MGSADENGSVGDDEEGQRMLLVGVVWLVFDFELLFRAGEDFNR